MKIKSIFMSCVVLLSATMIIFGVASTTATAGIWDSIKDAITGHTTDVIERVTVVDAIAPGFVETSNNFREDDIGVDAAHWTKGTAQVKRDPATGKSYIQLQTNFKSGLAPDLYVYVSKVDTKIVDETTFNAVEQIEISKLTKGSGASFYELPPTIKANEVQSITIWCKRFGAFMGSTNV